MHSTGTHAECDSHDICSLAIASCYACTMFDFHALIRFLNWKKAAQIECVYSEFSLGLIP